MGRGAILPPVNIAVLQPAAPAGTPQQSIAVIAIPLVHGASIRIRSIAEAKPAPAAARLPRGYLKTPNAPGQRAFLRCAASFFLEIRQYSCEKMSCATQKSLAAGHIVSFQIHPNRRFPASSITENRKLRHKNMEALGFFLTRFFRTYSGNIFESVLI